MNIQTKEEMVQILDLYVLRVTNKQRTQVCFRYETRDILIVLQGLQVFRVSHLYDGSRDFGPVGKVEAPGHWVGKICDPSSGSQSQWEF